jgi:argininosuccinate lyase
MPQKKNPDFTELIRAKVGLIHGAAEAVTLLLKGLPLAYNKDMQETQEPAFAVEFVPQMLELVARFTAALKFNRERMNEAAQSGYLNAMAAATYLVHKGVPFRTAHEKIGNAVRFAIEKGVELGGLTLNELRQFGEEFEEDFFAAVTLQATLDCHDVTGGTARVRVQEALAAASERIAALGRFNAGEAVHAGA